MFIENKPDEIELLSFLKVNQSRLRERMSAFCIQQKINAALVLIFRLALLKVGFSTQ